MMQRVYPWEVYAFIRTTWRKQGYAPSRREIMAHFNASSGCISHHIGTLLREGKLIQEPYKSRTLRPATLKPTPVPVTRRMTVQEQYLHRFAEKLLPDSVCIWHLGADGYTGLDVLVPGGGLLASVGKEGS